MSATEVAAAASYPTHPKNRALAARATVRILEEENWGDLEFHVQKATKEDH
jgi:hypothetical protein